MINEMTQQKASGFSLIEMMIAMGLGLFLSLGMFSVYSSNKSSLSFQTASMQVQRNAQFSLGVITNKINSVGYTGFFGDMSAGVENDLKNAANELWDISTPLRGFNNVSKSKSIAGVSGFIQGTDVLLLKQMTQSLSVKSNTDNKTIKIDKSNRFTQADILLLADIDQASLFQANSVITAGAETTVKLTLGTTVIPGNKNYLVNAYGEDAELGKLHVNMYYIKKGKNNQPALYEAVLVNTGTTVKLREEELASNITNFQLVYGVDENGDQVVDDYKDASAVISWNNVLSVGMALLVSSNNAISLPKKTVYEFDVNSFNYKESANTSSYADKRLKKTFRSFAAIRNRTL